MSTGQSKVLANAELERRGLRIVLYIAVPCGLAWTFLTTNPFGAVVAAVTLAGLATSCRPIADPAPVERMPPKKPG